MGVLEWVCRTLTEPRPVRVRGLFGSIGGEAVRIDRHLVCQYIYGVG